MSQIWLAVVGVPAVAIALFTFTVAVSDTPSTLGGEETPTVAATTPTEAADDDTPTTAAGTPTSAATTAATSTPAAGGTAAAGTATTAPTLPETGVGDDGPNANANLLWVLGLVVASLAVGSVLLLSSRRR
jgi:hypothetical protein